MATGIARSLLLPSIASGCVNKAVDDGDMTAEKASTLGDLLEQSAANLTPADLDVAVTEMAAACGMFD